jgi:ATP-dependent DNA ligase
MRFGRVCVPEGTFIDGDIAAYDVDGRPSFNVLQNHRSAGSELYFYAFDLLTHREKDLTRASLEKRR